MGPALTTPHPTAPALSVSWDISSDRNPDAYESYRSSIAELYDVSGVKADGRIDFSSRTTAWKFGASSLGRGVSGPQTLIRRAHAIRRSGIDHINLMVNRTPTLGEADGRSVVAASGAVQFRDLARPSGSVTNGIDLVTLMVPRVIAEDWILDRDIHGLVLAPDSAGGRLIASHLHTLVDIADHISEEEGLAAIEAAFVIAQQFMGQKRSISRLHADAIHRTIRRQATILLDNQPPHVRPDVDATAAAVGVSRTTLYRAFAAHGGVHAFVGRRRMDQAHSLLRIQGAAREQIEATARRFGYSSRAAFTRAFRDRFGFSPGDVRPSAHARRMPGAASGPRPGIGPRFDGAVHDLVFDWMRAPVTT